MAQKSINLPNNWGPRKYQKPLWEYLSKGGKRAVVAWHRRSGKDAVMLHHNACAAFEEKGNYWYLLPEYNQCRKAVWDAVNPWTGKKRIDEAFPLEVRKKTLEQEMKIIFANGSSFQLMGSDNYNALVGSTPRGVTFSEYALSNPASWGFIRPILLENKGWAIFNSTPRGKNHFYKMVNMAQKSDKWFSEILTADDTGVFSQEDLLEELAELQDEHGDTFGKAIWLQEYFCSFEAAIPGSIWGESLAKVTQDGRITDVPHTEGYPVFTAWDLGRRDHTSVWFYQVVSNEIRVIDFYNNNFREIPELAEMLREKKEQNGYDYGRHWVPHDAIPVKLGMGGKSMMQQFIDEDVGAFSAVPSMGRDKGIQAARATFKHCWFDREKCGEGVEHLKSYHRKYDEKTRTFSDEPVHDDHSHPADGFRYLSLSWKFSKAENQEMSQAEKFQKGNITAINFGQMKKAHFSKKRAEREYG